MSSASFPSAEPQVGQSSGLSEPQRIINTFIAPTSTFADLRRKASWWVPFLLSCMFAYGMVITVDKQVGFERVTENQIKLNPKASERLDQLPADQRARQMDLSVKITKGISYAIPVIVLIINVIIAAILMATFNFGVGTEITFGQSLAIVMYSGLVGIVKSILAMVTLFAGANLENFNFSNPVGTNPAYYMDVSSTAPWLYRLSSWFDVITLWLFILIGVGFAVVGRKKISTGIAVMLGWFIVMALGSAAIGALSS
ncbi:MAG: YIP1 family protein [Acidobacteria bacterium]|nr:YIP1 family protein [Acidobacteriota bacterium]MBV9146251.1 YIP1 family protein [Acidobacteriota bacterium]MBV9436337.1 YIP1 family protein [Acidobacteriota bacterium]